MNHAHPLACLPPPGGRCNDGSGYSFFWIVVFYEGLCRELGRGAGSVYYRRR